jgi:hypothetical protein
MTPGLSNLYQDEVLLTKKESLISERLFFVGITTADANSIMKDIGGNFGLLERLDIFDVSNA